MKIIGFICSSSDFTYALLEGGKTSPIIVKVEEISFPKGCSRSAILKWLYYEVEQLLKRFEPKGVLLKRAEHGASKDKSYTMRVENEAVILLLVGMLNIKYVDNKVKPTILKDLGYKGRSRYFAVACEDVLSEYNGKVTEKIKEAIMVARSAYKSCQ